LYMINLTVGETGSVFWTVLLTVWARELGYENELSDQEFNQFVAALARALPYVACSSFAVDQVVESGGYLGEDTFDVIGRAQYPIKMLVERSCSPNSMAFSVGRQVVIQVNIFNNKN
jgi:hypothetical protein